MDNTYQLSDYENNIDLTGSGGFSVHDGGAVLAGALWDFAQAINDVETAPRSHASR